MLNPRSRHSGWPLSPPPHPRTPANGKWAEGLEEQKRTPHGRLRGLEKAASPQAEQRMRRRPLVLRHGRGARGHRGLEPAAQQLRLACLLPRLRAQPPSAEKSAPPIPSVRSSSFPTISRTMRVSPAKWGAVSTTSGPSGRALPGQPWSERALVPSVGRVSIPSPATAPSRRGLYGSPRAQQRTASPLSPGDTRERPLAGVRLAGLSPLGSTTTSRAMYAAARREFTACGGFGTRTCGPEGKVTRMASDQSRGRRGRVFRCDRSFLRPRRLH